VILCPLPPARHDLIKAIGTLLEILGLFRRTLVIEIDGAETDKARKDVDTTSKRER